MTAGRVENARVEGRSGRLLLDLVRQPGRGKGIRLLLGAILVGAICWLAGMDAWHAVTIGGGLVAAGIVWLAAPVHSAPEWTNDPTDQTGARPEVMRLSWTLRSHRGQVGRTAVDRVRGIARSRLGSRALDLDDPGHAAAIGALIGDHAYRIFQDQSAPTVPLRSLLHCIERVEALDPPSASDRSAPPVGLLPAGLLGRRTRHVR